MLKSNRMPYFYCVSCLFLAQIGCGPQGPDLGPFGEVSGHVTHEGKPVSEGMITFSCSQSGQVSTANLQEDGSYVMNLNGRDGLPLGAYTVTVRPPLNVKVETDPSKMRRNNLYDPSVSVDIPMMYRYESSSGLSATVSAGANEFDFDLKKEGG